MINKTSDILEGLESKLNSSSDIGKAMEEFFRDKKSNNPESLNDHDIDLRSRLIAKAIKGHSVINFLASFVVKEASDQSLADGLGILSVSLKRHVLSHEGKSRQEIIDLFKAQTEAGKPNANFNMFAPNGGAK